MVFMYVLWFGLIWSGFSFRGNPGSFNDTLEDIEIFEPKSGIMPFMTHTGCLDKVMLYALGYGNNSNDDV